VPSTHFLILVFFSWQVERKASKGRKVRYNVHDKLQNFMFPLSLGTAEVGGIDAEKLFHSLFQ